MLRKWTSSLLALLMVFSLLPTSVVAAAAGEPEAKIGDTEYATLQEAVEAVPDGGTIQMLKDAATELDPHDPRWADKTYSIDKKHLDGAVDKWGDPLEYDHGVNKYTEGVVANPTGNGDRGRVFQPATIAMMQSGTVDTFMPNPYLSQYTLSTDLSKSVGSTMPTWNGFVNWYTDFTQAIDSHKSSTYNKNVIIILHRDLNVGDITVTNGPTCGYPPKHGSVAVYQNGHNFTYGTMSKDGYMIEPNTTNLTDGVQFIFTKSYTGSITKTDGSVTYLTGTSNENFTDANAAGEAVTLEQVGTITFSPDGDAFVLNSNVTWKIPAKQTAKILNTLTIDGTLAAEGTVYLGENGVLKVKTSAKPADEKLTCAEGNTIKQSVEGEYTVYSVQKPPVASVGGTQYTDIADALAAAKGTGIPVVVLNDCYYQAFEDVILDLNGHTVQAANNQITFAGDVVIQDSSAEKNGVLNALSRSVIPYASGATLTVKSGTIEGNGAGILADKACSIVIEEGATVRGTDYGIALNAPDAAKSLVINGTVTGNSGALTISGIDANPGNTVTINAPAQLTCSSTNGGAAVYAAGYADWTINGGTFTGYTALYQRGGKITVNGGTFNGTGAKTAHDATGGGFTATGDAIVLDSCNYPSGIPELRINNAAVSVMSRHAEAIASYESTGSAGPAQITLTAGTYSSDPTAFVAPNYVAQTQDDGTFIVVLTPADYSAVNAAIAKIPADLSLYTTDSAKAVTDAKNAVVLGLDVTKQADVDAMAQAIEVAVAQLVYKDADYSAVNAAITKIPADLSLYTADSAKAVTDAKNAVVLGLDVTKQADVDAMAQAIEVAVDALVLLPEDTTSTGIANGDASIVAPVVKPDAPQAQQDAMQQAHDAIAASGAVTAAGLDQAVSIDVKKDGSIAVNTGKEILIVDKDALVKAVADNHLSGDIKVVAEPFLQVQVTDAVADTKDNGDITISKVTFDIKPFVGIKVQDSVRSATLSTNLMDLKDQMITITLTLPDQFEIPEGYKVQVLHTKDDGTVYTYDAVMNGNQITFQNPNGFSTFTVQTVPVADHVQPNDNTEAATPQTADSTQLMLWTVMAVVALAGLAVVSAAKKKATR